MTDDHLGAIAVWITATVAWTAALILVLLGCSWHWFAALAAINAVMGLVGGWRGRWWDRE